MKNKTLFTGLMVSVLLVVAQGAKAVAYAPGEKMLASPDASGNMMVQSMPENLGDKKMYIQNLQQGTLTPQQQMQFYKMTQGQMGIIMPQNMGYQVYGSSGAQLSYNKQMAWVGLMIVMTVILVWANLLLLIAFLWNQVKKHKHH
jgi:hypothetical protein